MKLIVVLIILITVTLFFVIDPISQPQNYYDFSDYINYYGINNFCNVISNIPFIIVGLVGLFLNKKQKLNHDNYSTTPVYSLFFLGVFLTGFGSFWFHLNPNNETLVWDRLPMTMGFMALTVGLLSEYFKRELQKQLLYPFIFIGFFSVMYWYFTEKAGRGDLRLYALVQFVPLIIIPAVALTHKSRYTRSLDLIWCFVGFMRVSPSKFLDASTSTIVFSIFSPEVFYHIQ